MSSGRFPLVKLIIVLVIVLATASGYRFLMSTRPTQPARPPEAAQWPVKVEPLQRGDVAPVITLFGRVESPHATRLAAAITADVAAVPAQEADTVGRNQLLVQLDDREAKLALRQREAELLEAEAQLDNEQVQYASNQQVLKMEQELLVLAQNELERTQRLQQTQLASQNLIDTARQAVVNRQIAVAQRELAIASHAANVSRLQAAVDKARAQRDLARLDLSRTRVTAPFAAIITELQVVPGMRVRSGDALVDLYEAGRLEVRAQVPTTYLPLLRSALSDGERLTARITPENVATDGSTSMNSLPVLTLDRVTGDIKSGQSNVDALFRMEARAGMLAKGQVLKLHLTLPVLKDVFTVPAEALYGENRIFTVEDDRLRSHSVQRLGLSYDAAGEECIILKDPGLAEASRILSTQLPNAIDGLPVTVRP